MKMWKILARWHENHRKKIHFIFQLYNVKNSYSKVCPNDEAWKSKEFSFQHLPQKEEKNKREKKRNKIFLLYFFNTIFLPSFGYIKSRGK